MSVEELLESEEMDNILRNILDEVHSELDDIIMDAMVKLIVASKDVRKNCFH